MKKCPKCGTENPDDAKFCKKCGAKLEEDIAQTREGEPKKKKEKSEADKYDKYGKIVGIVGIFFLGIFIGPIAIYFGHKARKEDSSKGKWGITLGVAGLFLWVGLLIWVGSTMEPVTEEASVNLSAHWDLTLGGGWWLETEVEFKNPTENDIQIESMELKAKLTDEWIDRQDLNPLVSEVSAGSERVICLDNISALMYEEVTFPWKYKAIIYTSRGRIVTNTVKPEVE